MVKCPERVSLFPGGAFATKPHYVSFGTVPGGTVIGGGGLLPRRYRLQKKRRGSIHSDNIKNASKTKRGRRLRSKRTTAASMTVSG